jgi:hypothetical protein
MSGIITDGKKNLSADPQSLPVGRAKLRLSRPSGSIELAEVLALSFAPLALRKTCPDSVKWSDRSYFVEKQ